MLHTHSFYKKKKSPNWGSLFQLPLGYAKLATKPAPNSFVSCCSILRLSASRRQFCGVDKSINIAIDIDERGSLDRSVQSWVMPPPAPPPLATGNWQLAKQLGRKEKISKSNETDFCILWWKKMQIRGKGALTKHEIRIRNRVIKSQVTANAHTHTHTQATSNMQHTCDSCQQLQQLQHQPFWSRLSGNSCHFFGFRFSVFSFQFYFFLIPSHKTLLLHATRRHPHIDIVTPKKKGVGEG